MNTSDSPNLHLPDSFQRLEENDAMHRERQLQENLARGMDYKNAPGLGDLLVGSSIVVPAGAIVCSEGAYYRLATDEAMTLGHIQYGSFSANLGGTRINVPTGFLPDINTIRLSGDSHTSTEELAARFREAIGAI